MLAKDAVHIWIGPKEQVARAEPIADDDDEGPGRQELRRRFWTGLNDYFVAEHPALPDVEARPSWNIATPSSLRHVGVELRFSLRNHLAGIDVWFWREASLPVWERIRQAPGPYNELIGEAWGFHQVEGRSRACIYVDHSTADMRREASWPEVYRWLGEKLSLVYEKVVPELREVMDHTEGIS